MSRTAQTNPTVAGTRLRDAGGFDNADTNSLHLEDFNIINVNEADKQAATEYFNTNGIRGFENFLNNRLNAWRSSPLKVAITGESGSGKSMLINTIRGLNADDEGAALTGVTETTDRVKDYVHPENTNLTFYDLPGVGTPNFPRATYLKKVDYKQYDFFLIVSRTRFTENDLWLSQEVKKYGKSFFFVRTHVDQDLVNEARDRPATFDEETVVERIKSNSMEYIKTVDSSAKVFVICGLISQTTKYDYGLMVDTLLKEYPAYKRQAMILSMTMNCKEVMKAKVNELRSRVWMVATLSAGVAAIPVPGLSFVVDQGIIVKAIVEYKQQLGLDDGSLARIATLHEIPMTELKQQIETVFSVYFFSDIQKLVFMLLQGQAVAGVAEEFSRYIPFVGSVVAAGISFGMTMSMLHKILNDMEKAALLLIDIIKERSKARNVQLAPINRSKTNKFTNAAVPQLASQLYNGELSFWMFIAVIFICVLYYVGKFCLFCRNYLVDLFN